MGRFHKEAEATGSVRSRQARPFREHAAMAESAASDAPEGDPPDGKAVHRTLPDAGDSRARRRPPVLDQMRRAVMSEKIERHHLERKAIVYVRQSSVHQVMHNRESRALQYAMRERVGQLGWSRIEVIDDDQGRSASGSAEREGFNRMVAEVCLGKVGAVAAREVSRFARNSRGLAATDRDVPSGGHGAGGSGDGVCAASG